MVFGLENKFQTRGLKPDGYCQNTYSLLLCTIAINILSLALPIMTLQIYDRILPNPGTGTLPILIAGVCLAICLEAILRLCRSYAISRAGASYEHRMSCKSMNKVLGADLSKAGKYGVGEHLHRVGSIGKLKDFYSGYSFIVWVELAFVPVFLGLIIYIAHYLAIVPIVILSLFTAISLARGYNLRKALKHREEADDARFNFLIEALEGVHTLKAFALEKFFERRYEKLEEKSCLENFNVCGETSKTFNSAAIFSHIMVAAVISVGAWLVLQGGLSSGALIASLLLAGRMMQPVQKSLALWAQYQDYSIARSHIKEILDTPQKTVKLSENVEPNIYHGTLELNNLTYKHRNENNPILNNISFHLSRGEAIMISGVHGSGKTSLLNVIAGLYPSTHGDVVINGRCVNTYPSHELVKHVGYIRTEPLIFRGSIRDNITCFQQTPEKQAREVASYLNLDQDIAKLPAGFDTFLSGTASDSIPPGLKQRIAIVRVLASKPRIILFDNADSSLDKEGYAMIYSLLARLKSKTSMVLVSDDRNIRALADRHLILNNGELVDSENISSIGANNIRPYKELRL